MGRHGIEKSHDSECGIKSKRKALAWKPTREMAKGRRDPCSVDFSVARAILATLSSCDSATMPIGDLSFTFPLALLPAIALIPALWWFFRSRRDEGIALRGIDDYRRAFGSDRLLRAVMYGSLALSVAAVCVLAAGPRISERQVSVSKEGVDIALVLDLSKSMLAEDMTPNRIGAAKNVIKDFLRRLDGDRIGLVLFAGKPFVSVPLSFDYASIAMMTDRITTDSIDQSAGA